MVTEPDCAKQIIKMEDRLRIDSNMSVNRAKIMVVDDESFNCDIIYGFLLILGIQNRKEMCEFAFNGE